MGGKDDVGERNWGENNDRERNEGKNHNGKWNESEMMVGSKMNVKIDDGERNRSK